MSIFSSLQPSPKVSRNAFDLSQRHVFSAKFGPVMPVCSIDTIPGSHYEIDVNQLLRSQPLQTAAFTGFKINYDVTFTPYNFVNHGFNQMIAGRGHNISPVFSKQSGVPTFAAVRFGSLLAILAAFERYTVDLYNRSQYDVRRDDDYLHYTSTPLSPDYSPVQSSLVTLDMLGYGNFVAISDFIYRALLQKEINTVSDRADYTDVLNNFKSLLDLPGVNTLSELFYEVFYNVCQKGLEDKFQTLLPVFSYSRKLKAMISDKRQFSLLRILNYNKVYFSFYRSTYYTDVFRFNTAVYGSTYEFPLDSLCCVDYSSDSYFVPFGQDGCFDLEFSFDKQEFAQADSVVLFCAFTCLKSHLYKRDMFTGVLPNTQFGDVSVVSGESVLRSISASEENSHNSQGVLLDERYITNSRVLLPDNVVANSPNVWNISPEAAISIINLRRADALQRFRERLLRAGDDVRSIFEAHGWPKPSSQMSEQPIFLGSFDGNFDINTVAATSPSDGVELGQLGANGVGTVSGKKIYFDCKDFGLIQVNFYLTKSAEYDSFGIDIPNTQIEQFDFPFPEFQNVSLSPVPLEAIDVIESSTGSQIVGYLPTSFGYKTAVDKVHGLFYSQLGSIYDPSVEDMTYLQTSGVFSNFVVPKNDLNLSDTEEFLYQSINAIDNIFQQSADSSSATDHFLINCFFDIKAVQPLPVIGLPI